MQSRLFIGIAKSQQLFWYPRRRMDGRANGPNEHKSIIIEY